MINKLEVVKFLLNEIEEEQKMFISYATITAEGRRMEKNNSGKYWEHLGKMWKGKREPRKSIIKNNCVKIRQLMSEINKEIDNEETD